jgi:hypothetical protein
MQLTLRGSHQVRVALVLLVAISGLLVHLSPTQQATAHMWAPYYPHVGYWPGTQERSMRLYDETGSGAWNEAGLRWATTHYNYWWFWWVERGIPVPYVDYQTAGGAPGCGNTDYGADLCIGDPGSGHAGLAIAAFDSNSHIGWGSTVIVRDGWTSRQKEAIVCQEVSHIMGLDHNDHPGSSASNTCMYPYITSKRNPYVAWNVHDDETFREFYIGHQP